MAFDVDGHEEYALVADLYDYVVPYRSRPDVAFFVDAAREAGSPVLEVGCGCEGSISIAPSREAEHLLARAGFEVAHIYAGYDRSPHGSTYPGELIFVARRK